MNNCIFLGRLTRDPELSFTDNGLAKCSFSLAVNKRSSKDKTAEYVNFTAWGKIGENVSKFCKKGQMILVQSHYTNRVFVDDKGIKRQYPNFNVEEFHFTGSKQTDSSNQRLSEDFDEDPDAPF